MAGCVCVVESGSVGMCSAGSDSSISCEHIKVAWSASILLSINNMQVWNEYAYVHYEFH